MSDTKNKPRNGVNSYYDISNEIHRAEPTLVPNYLDIPTLDESPNKKLEETIVNTTENTICKLNLQIQVIATEVEAIKIFVKEQFYLTKTL